MHLRLRIQLDNVRTCTELRGMRVARQWPFPTLSSQTVPPQMPYRHQSTAQQRLLESRQQIASQMQLALSVGAMTDFQAKTRIRSMSGKKQRSEPSFLVARYCTMFREFDIIDGRVDVKSSWHNANAQGTGQ
eukprot:5349321-Pleurochrysis_carterae.AAC.2